MRTFAFAAMLGAVVASTNSCKKEDTGGDETKIGKITGTVTVNDATKAPLEGVTVAVTGITGTATTAADGTYTIENVPVKKQTVTFTKAGYATITSSIAASKFDSKNVAVADAKMSVAGGKIIGLVKDGRNNEAPLAGVTVTAGSLSATTGADGKFEIKDVAVKGYSFIFEKADYPTFMKEIEASAFVEGVADLGDIILGAKELFPGLTIADLRAGKELLLGEYTGGGSSSISYWDWSTGNMPGSFEYRGDLEAQREGYALRPIRDNNDAPKDLEMFETFIWGRKTITADTKILSMRARTHQGDKTDNAANFGVKVVDLAAADPTAVKIADYTHTSGDYSDYKFDLSAFVGKEVAVVVGQYRAKTNAEAKADGSADGDNYWVQLPIARLIFSDAFVEGETFPGTELVEGWKVTDKIFANVPVQTKKSFTGITPLAEGNNTLKFQSWVDLDNHIATSWRLMGVRKDIEPFAGQGYLIKTYNNGKPADQVNPESFLYTKAAIAAGYNKVTLRVRGFSNTDFTYIKLFAVDSDKNVTYYQPTSTVGEAVDTDCWKFKHEAGEAGSPEEYAELKYDLSALNGKTVLLGFGIWKYELETGEVKLCIHSVEIE